MRNRALYGALRDFALEAAALLTDELRTGAEVEFDVIDQGGRRGPALYQYKPRTEAFIADRWARLRELDTCVAATAALGNGAALWLGVNGGAPGITGEQAEPALRAMLERLYEDATSFGFPEERFERLYREVEATLYRDALAAKVVAPLRGVAIEAERVELGDGLALVRGETADAPAEAVWPENGDGRPAVLCVLERDVTSDDGITADEAEKRFAVVVSALRLWAPGSVSLGAPGWRRTDDGPWQPLPFGGGAGAPAGDWFLPSGEESGLRDFFAAIERADPPQHVAWARDRFEMGCERASEAEALSDHLLALRALLDATTDTGEASLALRVAALCAEEGRRRLVQRRIESAIALERFVMGGGPRSWPSGDSPAELVAEVEGHLRALLRDVLCGYLDSELKGVADDILLETNPEPFMEIAARDLRAREPIDELEPLQPPEAADDAEDTAEFAAVAAEPDTEAAQAAPEAPPPRPPEPQPAPEPVTFEPDLEPVAVQRQLDGVTESADWGFDEPGDYSAPV
jgi:hypothetical protein